MPNVKYAFIDSDGIQHDGVLEQDDVIEIARYESAFSYSQAPGEFVETTVERAVRENLFDTCRGTISVLCRVVFQDGKTAGCWLVD